MKLIVIDISNFIFRAFYAIRPLNAPDGTPVNAVYGVLSMLHNMIIKYEPTHILVARDTKEGSFRKELYVDYKANRTEPPDDLKPQFDIIDNLIDCLGLAQIKMPGYEADDIIGSVVKQWGDKFEEILIASGDKDLMQFVHGPVKILDTMKEMIYGREDVKDKMGVYPEYIVDYLALIGDSSDNIPGVPGIGPKGAAGLIEEFGNLENILKNAENVRNKRTQNALLQNPDLANISYKLATIITDLELEKAPADCRYQLRFSETCEKFLQDLGFKSWITKLSAYRVKDSESQEEIAPRKEIEKTIPGTLDDLSTILENDHLGIFPHLTDDKDQFEIWKGVGVASSEKSFYFDFTQIDIRTFLEKFSNFEGCLIAYQSKSIHLEFLNFNLKIKSQIFDLAQAHFLLSPDLRHDLNTVIENTLEQPLPSLQVSQGSLFGISEDEMNYFGHTARMFIDAYPVLVSKLEELELTHPYFDLDIPLIEVLAEMEREGVHLNVGFYKELEEEFAKEITRIEDEVEKASGDKINLRSPKQVGELLFEKLGFAVVRKTKTGYSTDAEVLATLAATKISPIPEMLLKYREVEKLQSTYVKALPLMIHPKTGKIHTHFQPSNAATGRLSSDNPNLQNIPVRSENGRKLRRGFVPSQGRVLLSADYSQVELRLLAHFSQDEVMLEAFQNDLDIHKQTAAEVFELPLNEVSKDLRNSAKAINFGLMYGQTSFGLSQALRISQAEAKKYITSYFKKFHKVKSYLDSLKEVAEQTGFAQTLFGRKRALANINSTNRQVKAMAERIAINSPIQGTAADIIKLAMINIQKAIKEKNFESRMVLQVHDELIFDVVPAELEEMKVIVRHHMENAVKLSVPLKVEMGVGENWFDLK
ncbi:MAG TPA: DNA polymerase I [Bacteriovoracaceae bacterium]|nr:DNA polymerase I [Bacteriovoracaceae bacterium]